MADKICVICGEDCSTRPRVKSPEGQYACRACMERREAERARPAAALTNDDFALDDLGQHEAYDIDDRFSDIESPQVESNPCPNCGLPRSGGAVVCMSCGFNSASGAKVTTAFTSEKVKKERSTPAIPAEWWFPLLGVGGLIAWPVIATTSEAGFGVAFLAAALWNLIAYIMMIVAAFKDDDSKWGIIGICAWVPVIGWVASLFFVLYYCIFGSTRTGWKVNYWCSFFAVITIVVVLFTMFPDMLAEMAEE